MDLLVGAQFFGCEVRHTGDGGIGATGHFLKSRNGTGGGADAMVWLRKMEVGRIVNISSVHGFVAGAAGIGV